MMSVKRSIVGVLGAVAVMVGMTACGGGDDADDSGDSGETSVATAPAGDGGSASTPAVTIEGFAFTAEPVAAGEPFEVENKDSAAHTFTADDGAFDVELSAGSTASVDALDAGSYPFHCTLHPDMTGTLEVS